VSVTSNEHTELVLNLRCLAREPSRTSRLGSEPDLRVSLVFGDELLDDGRERA
jgi:hypothetical protein